jgi:uncharacterized protein (DUF433 family)
MIYNDRIVIDHAILGEKPIIRGTRISVEFILELLGNNWSREKIIGNYPQLENEDVLAALNYALHLLKTEHIYPVPQKATA